MKCLTKLTRYINQNDNNNNNVHHVKRVENWIWNLWITKKKTPIETTSPASIHPAMRLIGYPVSTPLNPSSPSMSVNRPCRMSMFFFRLHNLQRAEENKRKKRVEQQRQQQRQRRGAKVFKCVSDSTGHLTLAPSRLFERTPMSPSDSLDEIALQIPRWVSYHLSCVPKAGECMCVCATITLLNNINTHRVTHILVHVPSIEQLLPATCDCFSLPVLLGLSQSQSQSHSHRPAPV